MIRSTPFKPGIDTLCTRPHPIMGIPVHSLYGRDRTSAAMLRDLDLIVFDLHDIAARPYSYVSTLRCVLEAPALHAFAASRSRHLLYERLAHGPCR